MGHHSFTYSTVCLMKHPQAVPKRVLHNVWPSASSFNSQYLLFSLRSSSSWLCLLPCLFVTSILPSVFPLLTCFRRQFLCKIWKMWPIQSAFLLFTVCRIFFSTLTLCNVFISHKISSTDLHPSPAEHFKIFQAFLIYFLKCPSFSTIQSYTPNAALLCFFPKLSPILSVKFLLLVECCFCHGNPWLHFLCTSCIIYYHATQII